MEPMEFLRLVLGETGRHNLWRLRETLNLIASENIMSPLAVRAYTSDFMFRYAEGKPFKRYYQGTRHIDVLEDATSKFIAGLLGVGFVELRRVGP